ncbi:hypothetical protein [Psychromonas aquimarina]|uniref:hypothetical protein n=1 Tax=Psychromonas aquimarina TaxID=444919 RepID=UPI00041F5847|nr:hypothetical protein [Psychromonas aquimarina]
MKATGKLNGFESPAKEYAQKPLSLDELLLPHRGDTYLVEMDSDTMTAPVSLSRIFRLWMPA